MGTSVFAGIFSGGLIYFSSSLIASLCVYLWARPGKWELVGTACGALLFLRLFGLGGPLYARVMLVLCYWAIITFLVSFVVPFFQKNARRRTRLIEAMLLVPGATIGTLPLMFLASLMTPLTLDHYLYAFDGSFGLQPAFVISKWVFGHPWLRYPAEICYVNLPVGLALLYLLVKKHNEVVARQALRCFVLIGLFGWLGYLLFPGVGTVVTFGNHFPTSPPSVTFVPLLQPVSPFPPRNCIPSLHTSWALALFWFSQPLNRLWRIAAGMFAGLVLLFTITGGGHYLTDLVASLPFAVAIYALSLHRESPNPRLARQAAVIGGLVYMAWLLLIRFGTPLYEHHGELSWLVALATIGWTVWYRRHLDRSAGFSPSGACYSATPKISMEVTGSLEALKD
jgi:PAP2 superfamily